MRALLSLQLCFAAVIVVFCFLCSLSAFVAAIFCPLFVVFSLLLPRFILHLAMVFFCTFSYDVNSLGNFSVAFLELMIKKNFHFYSQSHSHAHRPLLFIFPTHFVLLFFLTFWRAVSFQQPKLWLRPAPPTHPPLPSSSFSIYSLSPSVSQPQFEYIHINI